MTTINRNKFRVQEVVSAGEIGGLLTPNVPLHSVTFNKTPVAKSTGEINFRGAEIVERVGAVGQTPVPGFESIAQTVLVGIELEDDYSFVTQLIPAGYSRTKVFLRYPGGLFRYTSKGRYESWHMRYSIEVSTDQSLWTQVINVNEDHRTQSSFDRVHVVTNPNADLTSPFYIRCNRLLNPGTERETGTMTWHANVNLLHSPQEYPEAAYYSTEFDAQQIGNVLPERGFKIKGILCQVPTTYQPTVYDNSTGEIITHPFYSSTVWDGTLQAKHCTDAALIAMNIMINKEWGAGNVIDQSTVDVFSFWEASKYNVEIINNTFDPPHPRNVWNGRISQITNLRTATDDILATCQASSYEDEGLIKCYQDRPKQPTKIFIPSTVVDGQINYQSTPLSSRFTVVEVTYNDKTNNYEPITKEIRADQFFIDAYGERTTNISLSGVVDRPQAIRSARWLMESSFFEGGSCSLAVGFENWDMRPGDIAYVADDRTDTVIYGRVLSVAGNQLEIDRPLVRTVTNEQIRIQTDLGIIEATVLGGQGSNVLTTSVVINTTRLDPFIIVADINNVAQYKAVSYSISDAEMSLSMGKHDPTKYPRIELGEDYTPEFPPRDPEDILPVTALTIFGFISDELPQVFINWIAPVDPDNAELSDSRVSHYVVDWEGPNGRDEVTTSDASFEVSNAGLGIYRFNVTAYTNAGSPSPSVNAEYDFTIADASTLAPPTALNGLFPGKDLNLDWTENQVNITHASLSVAAYVIEFKSSVGGSVTSSARIPFVDGQVLYKHQYNFDTNTQDNGNPSRTIIASLRVEDNNGSLSTPVEGSFSNTAPSAPTQTLNKSADVIFTDMTTQGESDIAGHMVEITTGTPGVTTEIDTEGARGYSFVAVVDQEYSIRSAAYDLFGKTSLNWSQPGTITADGTAPTARREFIFIGLVFSWLDPTDGSATGSVSWTGHEVIRNIITEGETPTQERKTIPAGSIAYDAVNTILAFDWTAETNDLYTFDTWLGIERHLHGEYVDVNTFNQVEAQSLLTADKIAANAISTNHLQAAAVEGENISATTTIVAGTVAQKKAYMSGVGIYRFWAGNDNPALAPYRIDEDGNTTINNLVANAGTFAGDLIAAGGTFSGNLSAAGGTFSGALSAASGSFAGDISAASGNFTGTVQANQIVGDVVTAISKSKAPLLVSAIGNHTFDSITVHNPRPHARTFTTTLLMTLSTIAGASNTLHANILLSTSWGDVVGHSESITQSASTVRENKYLVTLSVVVAANSTGVINAQVRVTGGTGVTSTRAQISSPSTNNLWTGQLFRNGGDMS